MLNSYMIYYDVIDMKQFRSRNTIFQVKQFPTLWGIFHHRTIVMNEVDIRKHLYLGEGQPCELNFDNDRKIRNIDFPCIYT